MTEKKKKFKKLKDDEMRKVSSKGDDHRPPKPPGYGDD